MGRDLDLEISGGYHREVGSSCGLRVFVTNTKAIEEIAITAEKRRMDVQRLAVGETMLIERDQIVCSQMANPCMTGIVLAEIGLGCFHSDEERLTEQQSALVRTAADGLVGSGLETIRRYRAFLESHNIRVIEPPKKFLGQQTDFNILVVTVNLPDVPQGVYYAY